MSDDTTPRAPIMPPDREPLRRTMPSEVAGGLTAVRSALTHLGQAGLSLAGGVNALRVMNQPGGFDCPGCAWPDPPDPSVLGEYCENGAKAFAEEATTRQIGAAFFAEHSVESLRARSDHWLGQQGRLVEPLIRRPGAAHYRPIPWAEAFGLIAEQLRALPDPNRAVFYTSGRTSNEAAFLYQLFVRRFGTNNLPDCSNLCHESSGVALSETVGIGKGSVTLEDFDHAQTILVIGQNPGTNHPRMLSALERAKERGARIIAINPLREAGLVRFAHPQRPRSMMRGGTALTDLYLHVRPGGDIPLLKGIMRALLDVEAERPGVVDRAFVDARTDGGAAFFEALEAVDIAEMAALARVPASQLREAARLIASGPRVIACWAMGITQHVHGVNNVREIVNLLLMLGSIGKPGAGTCPVRGHSNVQGDRTMGIHERPSDAFLDRLGAAMGFEPPRAPGVNAAEAIEAMERGDVDAFIALGGNFLSASPDTERTAAALERCALHVEISTKLNRSHLHHGGTALILPCLGRTERDLQPAGLQRVSVENSMGIVHASAGDRTPASAALESEPRIVAELAAATLDDPSFAELADDYARIRSAIEAVIPGFERYEARLDDGGFALPNPARDGRFGATGKARFTVNPLPDLAVPEGAFEMMTVRSHDQFNTTIYGLDDRYRGLSGNRRVAMMHLEDIHALGLRPGALVDLENRDGGRLRRAEGFTLVEYGVPRGAMATYFPEANALVPLERRAHRSHTPASKCVHVYVVSRA